MERRWIMLILCVSRGTIWGGANHHMAVTHVLSHCSGLWAGSKSSVVGCEALFNASETVTTRVRCAPNRSMKTCPCLSAMAPSLWWKGRTPAGDGVGQLQPNRSRVQVPPWSSSSYFCFSLSRWTLDGRKLRRQASPQLVGVGEGNPYLGLVGCKRTMECTNSFLFWFKWWGSSSIYVRMSERNPSLIWLMHFGLATSLVFNLQERLWFAK